MRVEVVNEIPAGTVKATVEDPPDVEVTIEGMLFVAIVKLNVGPDAPLMVVVAGAAVRQVEHENVDEPVPVAIESGLVA